MSEEMILRHCSPTLAGMKTGSLFNCPCPDRQKLLCAVKELNRKLVPKGVRVIPLRTTKNKMLLYIYRPQKLKDDLSVSGTARLLQKYGYSVECTGKCVVQLGKRLCEQKDFPHEIGVFLGYPLADVVGFIQNHGQNFTACGHWKVYTDPAAAQQQFARYKKCETIYTRCYRRGTPIRRLTVAA